MPNNWRQMEIYISYYMTLGIDRSIRIPRYYPPEDRKQMQCIWKELQPANARLSKEQSKKIIINIPRRHKYSKCAIG